MKLVLIAGLLVTTLRLSAADAPASREKAPTPPHISHGAAVNLSDYYVPGKTTIFDFYSEYCPPCRAIGPHMEALNTKRKDIAVVEVDINRPGVRGIDWGSPVAQQYKLESIPHFTIVNGDGKVIADGDEAYQKVTEMLDSAGA